MRLCRYHRVSKRGTGLGLAAQRKQTAAYLEALGHDDAGDFSDDGVSSRLPIHKRPALASAIAEVKAGRADGIIVAKLDRYSRSLKEVTEVLGEDFAFIALDIGVDTSTPAGKMVAHIMGAINEWERATISERTKVALREKRERGATLGRPRLYGRDVEHRIRTLRSDEGLSTREIARRLNRDGIKTASGGTWSHSTVAHILRRPE